MWKALKFCIIAVIILAIAWWVASLPGEVSANAAGYQIIAPVPVVLLLLLLLLVLVIGLTRILGGLRRGPVRLARWNQKRRHTNGEAALQRGLVAVAAGDASSAGAAAKKARSLLGDTAIVQWISAEAARLAGRTQEARQAFERLTQNQEMKFLGYQGLLREDINAGRWDDAARLAEEAENAWPGGSWTRQQRMSLALRQQNYTRALQLTQLAPERVALATAAAQQAETPELALTFAKQALKADSSQPLAIATLAQALRQAGKDRAARKTVLKGWKHAPSPQLAQAWFSPDASALDRAQDATKLASVNPGHVESELLLAQTSLEADLKGEARRHAEAAKAAGNQDGRADAILARLDNQPAPALVSAWQCTACHARQAQWAPVCPACGRVGTLVAYTPPDPAIAISNT